MGLVALSEAEKAILAAATLAADEQGIFDLKTLQDQIMVTDLSHSTFFRGIRSLTEKGLINRITDTKRSAYRVMVR
jgi:DNA-binding MarR family transcriptional regulator